MLQYCGLYSIYWIGDSMRYIKIPEAKFLKAINDAYDKGYDDGIDAQIDKAGKRAEFALLTALDVYDKIASKVADNKQV